MKKENISFSSDGIRATRKDLDETSRISEDYFGTQNDPEQMAVDSNTKKWVEENVLDYLNVIKNDQDVIGYAFLLPCNRTLMNEFVSRQINEADLFKRIKKIKNIGDNIPETLYLCASVIKNGFRHKGLATEAFVKMINKITENGRYRPILFAWAYSKKGGKLVNKI
ncbi:MAG: hypothetical protein KGH55_03510, partial [Nanoarchaeota archaeon]|nr:hypothetical protein [Nanoarchaeota archaeon]